MVVSAIRTRPLPELHGTGVALSGWQIVPPLGRLGAFFVNELPERRNRRDVRYLEKGLMQQTLRGALI